MQEAFTPISLIINQTKLANTPRDKQKLLQAPYGIYTLRTGLMIANRFKLTLKIGQGSFGQVYAAVDTQTTLNCVVKLEKRDNRPGNVSLLQREIKVLQELKGISGFPELMFFGRDKVHNYFMADFLGLNLEQLFKKCSMVFSMTTVLQIALQLIDRLEGQFLLNRIVFHSKNLIHRDIKPENFVIGRDDCSLIYMIDFGLSKYYRNSDGKHIEYLNHKGMIGTARYSSINALEGKEQSRRDDLESIGYMLIYFAKGDLPWTNIQAVTKSEKIAKILRLKINITLNSLCKGLPRCFFLFFQHIKGLLFTEQPNYTILRNLFQSTLDQIEEEIGFQELDWERLPEIQNIFQEQSDQFGLFSKESQIIQQVTTQKKQVQQQIKNKQNFLETVSPDIKSKMISFCNSRYNDYQSDVKEGKKYLQRHHLVSSDKMIVIPLNDEQGTPLVKIRKDSKSQTNIQNKSNPSFIKYKINKMLDDEYDMIADDDQPKIQMANYTSCSLKLLRQGSGCESKTS